MPFQDTSLFAFLVFSRFVSLARSPPKCPFFPRLQNDIIIYLPFPGHNFWERFQKNPRFWRQGWNAFKKGSVFTRTHYSSDVIIYIRFLHNEILVYIHSGYLISRGGQLTVWWYFLKRFSYSIAWQAPKTTKQQQKGKDICISTN